jgi:taurine dioxygenase
MDIREIPGPSHPIISTHPETGYNMIFLGRRHSAYVNGLSIEESESLLDELWKHTTQSEFTYKHEWQTGDIVIWDNRASLHRRDAFNSNSRRILYAAQVEGHAPFESNKSLENPSHPRHSQYFKK